MYVHAIDFGFVCIHPDRLLFHIDQWHILRWEGLHLTTGKVPQWDFCRANKSEEQNNVMVTVTMNDSNWTSPFHFFTTEKNNFTYIAPVYTKEKRFTWD